MQTSSLIRKEVPMSAYPNDVLAVQADYGHAGLLIPRGLGAHANPNTGKMMSQNFGMEMPTAHSLAPHRLPVRYLVVIDTGGTMVARLFLDSRVLVNEFDAAATEVSNMTAGLVPQLGALGPEWDTALQGFSAVQRAMAEVYTLAV
jgi:hypothetical protein